MQIHLLQFFKEGGNQVPTKFGCSFRSSCLCNSLRGCNWSWGQRPWWSGFPLLHLCFSMFLPIRVDSFVQRLCYIPVNPAIRQISQFRQIICHQTWKADVHCCCVVCVQYVCRTHQNMHTHSNIPSLFLGGKDISVSSNRDLGIVHAWQFPYNKKIKSIRGTMKMVVSKTDICVCRARTGHKTYSN